MNSKAKKMAMGGVVVALSIITLYLSSIFQTMQFSFLILASFYTMVLMVELGTKTAVTAYAAVSALSLFMLGDKLSFLIYALFCGNYAVIKYYIEKFRFFWLRWLLKLLYFGVTSVLTLALYIFVFGAKGVFSEITGTALAVIFAAAYVFAFILYDILFSKIILMYQYKWRKYLKF